MIYSFAALNGVHRPVNRAAFRRDIRGDRPQQTPPYGPFAHLSPNLQPLLGGHPGLPGPLMSLLGHLPQARSMRHRR